MEELPTSKKYQLITSRLQIVVLRFVQTDERGY